MSLLELLSSWYAHARSHLPKDVAVWDAHSHTGDADPDGVIGHVDELLEALRAARHAGAVVASNHNPAGYRQANDRILAEAAAAEGRLIPFLRVDPSTPTRSARLSGAYRPVTAASSSTRAPKPSIWITPT